MFAPVRGPWSDDSWRGWWDDNPPYRVPVWVLTHHARPPLEMEGGDGLPFRHRRRKRRPALATCASAAAWPPFGNLWLARLIDRLHVVVAPVLLGGGEAPFSGLDLPSLACGVTEPVASEKATHVVLEKQACAPPPQEDEGRVARQPDGR